MYFYYISINVSSSREGDGWFWVGQSICRVGISVHGDKTIKDHDNQHILL